MAHTEQLIDELPPALGVERRQTAIEPLRDDNRRHPIGQCVSQWRGHDQPVLRVDGDVLKFPKKLWAIIGHAENPRELILQTDMPKPLIHHNSPQRDTGLNLVIRVSKVNCFISKKQAILDLWASTGSSPLRHTVRL